MALSTVANFKLYLKKNKSIPENLALRYKNFTNFAYKIIKAIQKSDICTLKQVKKDLSESTNTEYKGSLTKKIQEFEKMYAEKK